MYIHTQAHTYTSIYTHIHTHTHSPESESVGCSIVSDSMWPHGVLTAGLLCPWNSPGKHTGVACHSMLQGIFPTQGLNWVSWTAGRFFSSWATREALHGPLYTCTHIHTHTHTLVQASLHFFATHLLVSSVLSSWIFLIWSSLYFTPSVGELFSCSMTLSNI